MAKKEIKKMSGDALNSQEELLARLRREFPEVFTEGKVDCKKLQKTLGEDFEGDQERYGISWAGKSNVFREIQTPTTKTLRPDRGESVDFDNTDNLFIEGDNLEVLKALQKSYYGKVKMIYIDPPYNTGKDFIYSDKWARTKAEEAAENGGSDENGNATRRDNLMVNDKSKGHFHSNWLNMMYPRLFLARNLMRQDGVIFVSIDDNEVYNLRMIMNEIFGEENFITQLVWEKKKKGSFLAKGITSVKEYILVFSKSVINFPGLIGEIKTDQETYPCINESNKTEIRKIPAGILSKFKKKNYVMKKGSKISAGSMELKLLSDLVIEDGELANELIIEGKWRYSQDVMEGYANNGELYITQDLYLRRIVTDPREKTLKDLLPRVGKGGKNAEFNMKDLFVDGWGSNEDGSEELKGLLGSKNLVDYPKPLKLIIKLIVTVRDRDMLMMDFFAGSGTTAHAVMKLNAEDDGNRKCISVQLPEETNKKSEAYKASYKTISDIAKERIRRAGKKVLEDSKEALEKRETPLDVGFKVLKLDESNFKVWQTDVTDEKELEQQMIEFVDNKAEGSTEEGMLYELLLKSGLQPTVEIEKKDGYHRIGDGQLIISLAEKMKSEIFTEILAEKPEKIIMLDTAFGGDDQLKTNLLLQAEDAGVEEVLVV